MYAVLARDYDGDTDWCCTCLHLNAQLHIYGYIELNKAISRLNNKDYCCPIKAKAPKEQLQSVLSQRMLLAPALHDIVVLMEVTYNARRENNCDVTGALTPTAISPDDTPCASEDDKASTDKASTDKSCDAPPSGNEHDTASTTYEGSTQDPQTKTYIHADYYERIKGTIAVEDGTVRTPSSYNCNVETKNALKNRKRRTPARVHNPATDDMTHMSTPSGNEHDKASTTNETSTKEDKANHAHNANRRIAPDDISCDAPPSGNGHDIASTYNESSTDDPQTEKYNPADYYEWEGQWYKWDDEEWGQEWLTKKSPKPNKKEPVNTRVRNWMLAMRRNMKPEVKQAALRPFTITRERLHEVRSYSL